MTEVACVIMASGLGRRFGSNKLTASFGEKPMIAWALNAAKHIFGKTIVVTRHEDVCDICRQMDVPVLLHDMPLRSDTIRLGLQAVMDGIQGCMFCPGDQPLITSESLERLACAFQNEPDCIWRLGSGMPVIFPKWAFEELTHLPEGSGGSTVIKRHPGSLRCIEPFFPQELQDADTPELLAEMEQFIRDR